MSKFDFSDCSSRNKKKFLEAVTESFTEEEIRKIDRNGKVIVSDRAPLPDTTKGAYRRKIEHNADPPAIIIRNNAEKATIIHELIHHERTVDDERRRFAITAYPINNKKELRSRTVKNTSSKEIKLAEETATITETEIRTAEPSKGLNIYWGAYERDRRETRNLDRKTMRTCKNGDIIPDGKAITGKKAIDMADRNYPKTIASNSRVSNSGTIIPIKDNNYVSAFDIFKRIVDKRRKGRW